jgi:cell division protein FtsI/penicillin-binding protein 2
MQNVQTGILVAMASSGSQRHDAFDITTPVLPLSLMKLHLAASWWERERQIGMKAPVDVHEMLVAGLDSAARQLATSLRQAVGPDAILQDLKKFGFADCSTFPEQERAAWYKAGKACMTLSAQTGKDDWASALSIGGSEFSVTLLYISSFLQAVGNNGMMLRPISLTARDGGAVTTTGITVMRPDTARKLQSAMKDVVDHGTARGIRGRLGSDWSLGGKTGTGPAAAHPYDGVFAGLVFDRNGVPRYTIVSYIKGGGPGGGAAAEITSDFVRFTLGL